MTNAKPNYPTSATIVSGDPSVGISGEYITIKWHGNLWDTSVIADSQARPFFRNQLKVFWSDILGEPVQVYYDDECQD
jgi:hypothetical protein